MTYDELRLSIEQWSENHDPEFLGQVDTCIRQAENRIVTAVRLPQFSALTQIIAASNTETTQAPGDFLAPDELWVTGCRPLLKKDPSFIREAYHYGTGTIRYYAMRDEATILWGPSPDNDYSVDIQYFNQPVSICDQHDGTYVSENFPAALLSGSLWMAAIYMKNFEAGQMHEAMFKDALGLSAAFANGPFEKQKYEKASSAVDGTNNLGGER